MPGGGGGGLDWVPGAAQPIMFVDIFEGGNIASIVGKRSNECIREI